MSARNSAPSRRSRPLARPFLLLLIGIVVVVSLFSLWTTIGESRRFRRAAHVSQRLERTVELNGTLRGGVSSQVEIVQHFMRDPAPNLERSFVGLHHDIAEELNEYLVLGSDTKSRLMVIRLKAEHAELGTLGQLAIEKTRAGERIGALETLARIEEKHRQVGELFDGLNELEVRALGALLEESGTASRLALLNVIVLSAAAVIAAGLLTYLVRRQVLSPLSLLLRAMDRIREGELSVRAPAADSDEIARLAEGFNYMASSLEQSYAELEQRIEERTRELREAQNQLVHSEKMSAVGRLVSGVAHELNNPLTAIFGMAELTRESLAKSPVDPEDVHGLEIILSQADRCRRIVADLLQFARQRETSFETVSLREVVQKSIKLREYELSTHGIRVDERYGDPTPAVRADPFKLQQVVMTLLDNAADAVRAAGGTGRITVLADEAAGRARLEIRDDGIGLADPRRVFDPFYTTKPEGEGVGLGLAICFGIVREHGGQIRAENLEQGARFVVELPLASSDVSPPGHEQTGRPGETLRITGRALVVDDEPSILEMLARSLGRLGLTVDVRPDGESALRYLRDVDVDLVLCDVRMPGPTDGPAVFEWLRRQRPDLDPGFLFMSGDLVSLESETSKPLPARCLRKPFSHEELYEAVRDELARVGRRS